MSGRTQRGFTMVELMVASALALLVIGVIGWLYVGAKQMTRVNEAVGRLQENGRFAIQSLDDDLRMAGFRGCAGSATAPISVLNSAAYAYQYGTGIAGYHGNGANWSPALDVAITTLAPPPLADSDVVTVRRIEGAGLQLTAAMANASAPLQVSAGSPVTAGDILLVADCTASAIFQATGVSGAGVIDHIVGAGAPGNSSADLGHVFRTDATVFRLVTRTYYVAPSARRAGVNSIWTNSVPSYDGLAQPMELVEGVERFVLLFGEDLDGDRAANRYVTADGVANWGNVVSAKPLVLVATTNDRMAVAPQPYTFNGATTTPTDLRLRTSLVSVVTLRNRVP